MKTVLLLGRTATVVDDAREQLRMPEVRFVAGTGLSDVKDTLADGTVDHVIMGAGLDLDVRLEIVREIFDSSETTTVHMKGHLPGPEGYLPFVRAVLQGLRDYEP
jgi:hypothetical protein